MVDYIPLIEAISWPLTIFILLIVFRKPIKSIIKIIETRLKEGDNFTSPFMSIQREVKEARRDIYAKVDTVKKLGEEFAEITAISLVSAGRVVKAPTPEELVLHRNRLEQLIIRLGLDFKKHQSITKKIDDSVRVRLVERLVMDLKQRIAGENFTPTERRDLPQEFQEILAGNENLKNPEDALQFLKRNNLLDDKMGFFIDQLVEFNKKGSLLSEREEVLD